MKKLSKIMVGCDFSSYSKKTLEYAAKLTEKLQAELIIVNVINKRDIDTILKVAENNSTEPLKNMWKRAVRIM